MAARKSRTSSKKTVKSNDLAGMLEPYFTTNAPFQIPAAGRKLIVQWLPWVSLVLGILCVLAFLPLVGLGAFVSALSATYGYTNGPSIWIPIFILLAQGIVQIIAVPGLLKRSLGAWKLLFWADVLYFGYSVLNAFLYPANLISGLIGAVITVAIGLYILFQVKSSYK